MTPEERAAKINWPDDLLSMSKEYGDALVATDIRDAENDAYEAAAKRVEEFLSGSAISVPIAEVIRFLKEPN